MERPVIILGGGVWGSLLAYRLKDTLPHIPFKLYEASETLGNHKVCSFSENECSSSMKWLRPLASNTWEKTHLIRSEYLHQVVHEALGDHHIKLNTAITLEEAQREGSFVIDARNICYFESSHYQLICSLEVELKEDHGLKHPMISQLKGYEIFPVASKTLLINLFESSVVRETGPEAFRSTLDRLMSENSWKIDKVIKESYKAVDLPLSAPHFTQDGRVINLAGIIHDFKGCSVPMAATLIDRMVRTSFRFGELREVVRTFREEIEPIRKYYRLINRFTNLKLSMKNLLKPLNKTTPKTV